MFMKDGETMEALLGKKGDETSGESDSSCTQEDHDHNQNAVQTMHLPMPADLSKPRCILFFIKCQSSADTLANVCLL